MAARSEPTAGPVGILCALPEELQLLSDWLDHSDLERGEVGHKDRRLAVVLGTLGGIGVALAETGVGKVNAAASAAILADRFGCRALILSGVAGGLGPTLQIGDLVVADRVIDTDYGRLTDAGRVVYQPGSLPLASVEPHPGYDLGRPLLDAVRTALAEYPERVSIGSIVCGDAFLESAHIRDELATSWSALAIEMEGAAICGVAERFEVPWLIVRALSDRAGENSGADFSSFVGAAAASSARLVRHLLPVVSQAAS